MLPTPLNWTKKKIRKKISKWKKNASSSTHIYKSNKNNKIMMESSFGGFI